MQKRSIPYMSMTDFIDEYLVTTLNERDKYINAYMIHAKWIYKKLLWNTIWQVVSKYVKVKQENGQYYVDVPAGSIRVINLSRIDEKGREIPFLHDHGINILAPTMTNGIICEECGEPDDLGACVNNLTVTTKNITVLGNPYVEKIWKKMEKDGTLMEIRETWAIDYGAEMPTAAPVTLYKRLCQFDIKPCGCLSNCDTNKQLVQLYCGSSVCTTRARLATCNDWAKVKVKDGRIYFDVRGKVPDFAKLDYQTNGECDLEEIMIPEYAVPAMTFGTHWRAGALAPANVVSPTEKRERERLWEKEKFELNEFLNPIRIADWLDVQMSIPKWGGTNLEPNYMLSDDVLFDISKLELDMGKCCCLSEDDVKKLIADATAGLNGSNGLQGPAGPQGPTGPAGDTQIGSYHHDQSIASTDWVINHNLGYNPTAVVQDKDGNTLVGWNFEHPTLNQMIIRFYAGAVAGDAYLA